MSTKNEKMENEEQILKVRDLLYLQRIIRIIEKYSIEELSSERCIRTFSIYFEALQVGKGYIMDKYLRQNSDKTTLSIWHALAFYGHYYSDIQCFNSGFKEFLNKKIGELFKKHLLLKFEGIIKQELNSIFPFFDSNDFSPLNLLEFTNLEIKEFVKKYHPNDKEKLGIEVFNNLEDFYNCDADEYENICKNNKFQLATKIILYRMLKWNDPKGLIQDNHKKDLEYVLRYSRKLNKNLQEKKKDQKNITLMFEVKRMIQIAIEYRNLQHFSELNTDWGDKTKNHIFRFWCLRCRELLKLSTPSSFLENSEEDSLINHIEDVKNLRDLLEYPDEYYYYFSTDENSTNIYDSLKTEAMKFKDELIIKVKNRHTNLKSLLNEIEITKDELWEILTLEKDITDAISDDKLSRKHNQEIKNNNNKVLNEYSKRYKLFKDKKKNRFVSVYEKLREENDRKENEKFSKFKKNLPIFKISEITSTKEHKNSEKQSTQQENNEIRKIFSNNGVKLPENNLQQMSYNNFKKIKIIDPISDLLNICESLKEELSTLKKEVLYRQKLKISDVDHIDSQIAEAHFLLKEILNKSKNPDKKEKNLLSNLEMAFSYVKVYRDFVVHEPWKKHSNQIDVIYILSGFCLQAINKCKGISTDKDHSLNFGCLYGCDKEDNQILHNLTNETFLLSLAEEFYEEGAINIMKCQNESILDCALKIGFKELANYYQEIGSEGLERSKRLRNFRYKLEHASLDDLEKFIDDKLNEGKKIFDPIDYPIATTIFAYDRKGTIEEKINFVEYLIKKDICEIKNSIKIDNGNSVGHFLIDYPFSESIEDFITTHEIDMNILDWKNHTPLFHLFQSCQNNDSKWYKFLFNKVKITEPLKKYLGILLKENTKFKDEILRNIKVEDVTIIYKKFYKNNFRGLTMEYENKDFLLEINNEIEKNLITKECFSKLFKFDLNELDKEKRKNPVFQKTEIFLKFENITIPVEFSVELLEDDSSQPRSYDMTLGKQFLKSNNVQVFYGSECIQIKRYNIQICRDGKISLIEKFKSKSLDSLLTQMNFVDPSTHCLK